MATIAQLKSWFETLDKPTQSQYAALIDSLQHRTDGAKLALDRVEGLEELINNAVTTEQLDEALSSVTSISRVVDDIASLPTDAVDQELVHVTDASDDATVDAGWALYRSIGDQPEGTWIKVAEEEMMDIVLSIASIPGLQAELDNKAEIPTYNLTYVTDNLYATTIAGVTSRADLPDMYYVVLDNVSSLDFASSNIILQINGSVYESIYYFENPSYAFSLPTPGVKLLVNEFNGRGVFNNSVSFLTSGKVIYHLNETGTIGDTSLIFNNYYKYTGALDATITLDETFGLLEGQSIRLINTTSNTVTLEGAGTVGSITGDLILEENDLVEIMCLNRSGSSTGGDYVVTRLNSREGGGSNTSLTLEADRVIIGQNNLSAETGGGRNYIFGNNNINSAIDNYDNILMGHSIGDSLDKAIESVLIGSNVYENVIGDIEGDVAIGQWVGTNLTSSAGWNTLIGSYVLYNSTGHLGHGNAILGGVGYNASDIGDRNVIMGYGAIELATDIGNSNVFIGDVSGGELLNGNSDVSWNVGIGANTFRNADGTNLKESTAIGVSAMRYGGGWRNTAIGRYAGQYVHGERNIMIGYDAGRSVDTTKFTGTDSTFIGVGSGFESTTAGISNVIVIGDYKANENNATYISATENLYLIGKRSFRLYETDGSDLIGFFSESDGIRIEDSQTLNGLYYNDDYSSSGIAVHGDRWIPDWEAVNGLFSGKADSIYAKQKVITSTSGVATVTKTHDNYAITLTETTDIQIEQLNQGQVQILYIVSETEVWSLSQAVGTISYTKNSEIPSIDPDIVSEVVIRPNPSGTHNIITITNTEIL